MPGQENARKYGVGQSAGSLGKLKGIIRKYEGICEKKNLLKIPGAGGITGWACGNPVKT